MHAQGIFPATWKRQKQVLLPKWTILLQTNMPSGCCGKNTGVYIICCYRLSRARQAFQIDGIARSTIDGIRSFTGLVEDVIHGNGSTNKYCTVVTLDVKSPINSAYWNLIRKCPVKIGIVAYLPAIVDSNDGCQEDVVFAGDPHCSVSQNIMNIDVLNLPVPEGTRMVDYVDGILLAVVTKHLEGADLYLCEAISSVNC